MSFRKYMGCCCLALGLSLTSSHTMASAAPLNSFVLSSAGIQVTEHVVNGSASDYYDITLDRVATTVSRNLLVFNSDNRTSGGASSDSTLQGNLTLPTMSGTRPGDVSAKGSLSASSGLSHVADFFNRTNGQLQSRFRSDQYAGTVSAVPLPAAAVLFGSALLGFVGFATRRRIS